MVDSLISERLWAFYTFLLFAGRRGFTKRIFAVSSLFDRIASEFLRSDRNPEKTSGRAEDRFCFRRVSAFSAPRLHSFASRFLLKHREKVNEVARYDQSRTRAWMPTGGIGRFLDAATPRACDNAVSAVLFVRAVLRSC